MKAEVLYRAPENSTQLAALERAGVLGVDVTKLLDEPKSGDIVGPSGGVEAHRQYQESTKSTWTKIGEGLNNVMQSQELQSLVDAGLEMNSARSDRKIAEQQASLARQKAIMQERMAQEEIAASKREQRRLEEMAAMQRKLAAAPPPQPSGGGMPGWLPIAIGGGALVLVIAMAKRKK